ncbi:MAG: hypothetical protein U0736_09540 [Gemmataceae bacterium]
MTAVDRRTFLAAAACRWPRRPPSRRSRSSTRISTCGIWKKFRLPWVQKGSFLDRNYLPVPTTSRRRRG